MKLGFNLNLLFGILLIASSSKGSNGSGSAVVSASSTTSSTLPRFECPSGIGKMNPAVIHGNKFYDEVTNEYIPIKGMAYYPRANDGPKAEYHSEDYFTDEYKHVWEPDIQNFVELNINTIRIYAVDPSKNHDSFMCSLQNVGIRVIVGLLAQCENCGIGPGLPPSCYSPELKLRGQWIINEFSKYNNTLVFSAGNEVGLYSNNINGDRLDNAPCQKKFLQDMRMYITDCKDEEVNSILPRKVPIGLVTQDINRDIHAKYYNCKEEGTGDGAVAYETAEWYGLNAYQHCDGAAENIDELVGWKIMKSDFERYNLPVPVIIAEFGCISSTFPKIDGFEAQRMWLQIEALFSQSYQDVFVGGIVFEYSTEKTIVDTSDQGHPFPYEKFMKLNYGIGYYTPEDCNHDDTECKYVPYPEYETLQVAYGSVDTSSFISNYNDQEVVAAAVTYPDCPVEIPSIYDFDWPTDKSDDLECYVINTPNPTMEVVPSAAPSMGTDSPTGDPLKCGVPSSCTDKVLNADAGDFTCRQRIQYLMEDLRLSQDTACKRIAVEEYPRECGPCDPYSESSSAVPAVSTVRSTTGFFFLLSLSSLTAAGVLFSSL